MIKLSHKLSNYHTHTQFCDGRNSMQEFTESAIEKRITTLGFSPHSPAFFANETLVNFDWCMKESDVDNYLAEVDRLRLLYPNLTILKGIEADYYDNSLPSHGLPSPKSYADSGKFDYVIGSVHMVKSSITTCGFAPIDSKGEILKMLIDELGSTKKLYHHYFNSMASMIENGGLNILAHMDLINKGNQNKEIFDFESDDFVNKAKEVMQLAKERNVAIEINTGYMVRKGFKEPLPSLALINEAIKIGNLFCINSDCHVKDEIDFKLLEFTNYVISKGAKIL